MNRKIDSSNQPEDTEGHRVARTRRPASRREDTPADTEGHRVARTKRVRSKA